MYAVRKKLQGNSKFIFCVEKFWKLIVDV